MKKNILITAISLIVAMFLVKRVLQIEEKYSATTRSRERHL